MNTLQEDSASKILPLVKAIGAELRDRATTIAFLQERLEAFQSTRSTHSDEIVNLQAELSIHRRELRRCKRELTQLGCSVDESDPLRITCNDGGESVLQLDELTVESQVDTPL